MEFSNKYIFSFALLLCLICSLAVSFVHVSMRDMQVANAEADQKSQVLQVAGILEPGVKLTGEANGRLVAQVAASMPDLPGLYEKHGLWNWEADGAGVLSGLVLVLGLCACLLHFYFSAPHNKPMRVISRIGVLTLMLSFGASFGFTVMGLSLIHI